VSELQSVLRKQFEQFELFESAQETQKEFALSSSVTFVLTRLAQAYGL